MPVVLSSPQPRPQGPLAQQRPEWHYLKLKSAFLIIILLLIPFQVPSQLRQLLLQRPSLLADNKVDDDERSLIRAIAASMDLPMPPLKVS
jgi:hypothetical protein